MNDMRKTFEATLRTLGPIAIAAAVIFIGTIAEAVDITGTWVGNETCICFNNTDGKVTENFRNEEMLITQNGTDLNIMVFGDLFNGNVIHHPTKDDRGVAAFIACRTDPNDNDSFGEIGLAELGLQGNRAAEFKVESLWNASQTEICKCKWNFKRTDTGDPSVGTCLP